VGGWVHVWQLFTDNFFFNLAHFIGASRQRFRPANIFISRGSSEYEQLYKGSSTEESLGDTGTVPQ
jgi:hypothetical protein